MMKYLSRLFILSAIMISIIGCSTVAEKQSRRGIPIVVMAEDSDPNSVKRSSDIFRSLITELQGQMQRYDYYVIQEEFMGGKTERLVRDRRPKTELVQFMDLASKSWDATLSPRAMVLVKIRAAVKSMGFASMGQIRLNGSIYDVKSKAYLGEWELPVREFPVPRRCDAVCISEIVEGEARSIATILSDTLNKRLAYLSSEERP